MKEKITNFSSKEKSENLETGGQYSEQLDPDRQTNQSRHAAVRNGWGELDADMIRTVSNLATQ